MRRPVAILALAAVVASPWAVSAEEQAERAFRDRIQREQVDALHDLEQAETQEEAEAAMRRFDDASMLELQRRRGNINDLIDDGGTPGRAPRGPAPVR